jgi:hypothetical protein
VSEWNLSVRLTGQGSSLARTLRDTARDARAASRDVNALRRDIDRLRTSSRTRIRIRLGVDAAQLRSDVSAALTSAGTGQGLAVNLRLANAMQLRRDVDNAVRWASWGHRIEIPIGLRDPNQLRRDVTAAVRRAQQNQTIRIRVTADTSALNSLGGTLGGGGGGSRGSRSFLRSVLMMAPAAIPLLAGLSTGLAPLPGLFAASSAGATAFGLALAGQIGPLADVLDAEKKYQEAVQQHGTSSKEAMEAQLAYQRTLAALPKDSQKAAIALSQLKQDFGTWSNQMSRFTMEPVTKGVAVLDALLPRLTPHVQSSSAQLDRLITIAGGAVETPGFDAMADRFADFTDRQLEDMTDGVVHFLRLLSEGNAFSNGPMAEFIAYAKENGPEAREALSAISAALVTLLRGAAEAGPTLLTLVTYAARLISAFPPELVGIIIQVATGLKLLQLAGAGVALLAAGFASVSTALAGLSATSAAAGGGLAGLSAAFASLGLAARASIIVAGIAAIAIVLKSLADSGKQAPPNIDKLTGSLAKLGKTGKVTGEAARAFGKDFSGLADSLRTLSRPSNLDKTQQFLTKIVGMDSTPVKEAKADLDAVDKSLARLVQDGKGDLAAAAFDRIAAAMRKQGMSGKELRSQLDDYKSAVADAKFEAELAAESMGLFGQAAQDTQNKLDAQKQSADGLRQSIQALNAVNREGAGAMNAFEQSIDDAAKAASENAGALKMNNGELDLNSESAREAESALRDLAANTDDAAVKAREQGKSWEYVQGILTRGQETFVTTAQKMGLTKTQAQALAQSYLDIPDSKATTIEMRTEDAIAGLDSVIAAINKTPKAKSVTVSALTADAVGMLQDLGFTVKKLPDGRFSVTADTATAKERLASVQAARDGLKNKTITITAIDQASAQARAIQAAIDKIRGKSVTVTTVYQTLGAEGTAARNAKNEAGFARGGIVDFYANGGIRHFAAGSENHIAQIAPAGSWRVWGEPETMGEAYVPFAPSKRVRSRAITEEVVRRLGGDPSGIQWNADGSVTGWRYDPQTGSLYSPSDAGQAGRKTKKVGGKDVAYFDLGAVEKKLKSISAATTTWNKDLEKVADRVGGDVAEALASMGEEGKQLAHKMATGSTKYINDMAAALRNLQATAKASLTDYTRQLGKANTMNKQFADNLAKLAAQGHGDLASQLAAQNDEAAQQLAAAAVKDPKKAAAANTAAKNANSALSADQVATLVQIIAAITSNKIGIHDVAAKTQIGEDEIIAVATKAKGQIHSSLGNRATKFLADLAKANAHQAYADGGIRAGIYATQAGIIRFAEPETGGEAFLPLAASKRRTALPVLAQVAQRFGLGLTDGQAGRSVVVVRHGDTTQVTVTPVRTGASASDIGFQVGRSVRRARRGGVNARAGG